jgi:hypothetical protein
MPLQSALEDLRDKTLRKVTGLLGRLEYLASLRGPGGRYSHWGLSRVHGEQAAETALSEAHRAATSEVLRTPLRKMLQDVEASGGARGVDPEQYAKELEEHSAELLPPHPSAGSVRHFSSVMRVLSYLVKPR